jgi:hypothetical protein
MTGGIVMAASHNHTLAPAHAHLNLLGWASLFLIGLFYRGNAALDASRIATAQVGAWVLGTIVLIAGVTGIYAGYPQLEPAAGIGSIIVVGAMLLFAYLVFRPERASIAPSLGMAPAE